MRDFDFTAAWSQFSIEEYVETPVIEVAPKRAPIINISTGVAIDLTKHRFVYHGSRLNPDWERIKIERAIVNNLKQHNPQVFADMLLSQNGKCWWCDADISNGYVIDHRIPVSRGGTSAIGNLCLSCEPCNSRKCAAMPWERMGRLL